MIGTWLVSLALKNASIVDIVWGLGFVLVAWAVRARVDGNSPTDRTLLVAMTTLWGLRLAGYLFIRNHGKGEDFRYRAMRKHWGPRFPLISLGTVFALQGVLMCIVSLPVQLGQVPSATPDLGVARRGSASPCGRSGCSSRSSATPNWRGSRRIRPTPAR